MDFDQHRNGYISGGLVVGEHPKNRRDIKWVGIQVRDSSTQSPLVIVIKN